MEEACREESGQVISENEGTVYSNKLDTAETETGKKINKGSGNSRHSVINKSEFGSTR